MLSGLSKMSHFVVLSKHCEGPVKSKENVTERGWFVHLIMLPEGSQLLSGNQVDGIRSGKHPEKVHQVGRWARQRVGRAGHRYPGEVDAD